ncbi:helix-turn-helix domain-containing protein [Corynebacterium callunae]|uniref:helix-turn-helix domain-containing protein n=1 Tax=Corynebacterium callunae TaxID=1721 RepID=UPI001FFF48AA|nr:helix-turn-helix domain-containing protein [Corynebacterium callunae]MCK2199158.1 helix-turn-helix domain-containing protein [Corynebacterium callunae]
MNDTKLTYTAQEAAEILGVSASSVYASVKKNEFPIKVIRVGERIIIPAKALHELLGI